MVWLGWHVVAPGTRVYAICLAGQPVGTLKLEGLGPGGWANLALMIGEARVRGSGVGARAIILAVKLAEQAKCRGVWAGMREKNLPSRHAFLRAGFSAYGPTPPPIVEAIRSWPSRPTRLAVWYSL